GVVAAFTAQQLALDDHRGEVRALDRVLGDVLADGPAAEHDDVGGEVGGVGAVGGGGRVGCGSRGIVVGHVRDGTPRTAPRHGCGPDDPAAGPAPRQPRAAAVRRRGPTRFLTYV